MPQTKLIPLSKGAYAKVDADDYEWLSKQSWHLGSEGYAIGKRNGKNVRMHRLINKTPDHLVTDHLNSDRLDNRKANLRSVTQKENSSKKSNVKGYCFDKTHKYYVVRVKGRLYGTRKTEIEAKALVSEVLAGRPKVSGQHPRRRYLPKGVRFMQPIAEKGGSPYYIRPQINGKKVFKGYFSSVQEAERAYKDLIAQGG